MLTIRDWQRAGKYGYIVVDENGWHAEYNKMYLTKEKALAVAAKLEKKRYIKR
jgi:hypothetical protein